MSMESITQVLYVGEVWIWTEVHGDRVRESYPPTYTVLGSARPPIGTGQPWIVRKLSTIRQSSLKGATGLLLHS